MSVLLLPNPSAHLNTAGQFSVLLKKKKKCELDQTNSLILFVLFVPVIFDLLACGL